MTLSHRQTFPFRIWFLATLVFLPFEFSNDPVRGQTNEVLIGVAGPLSGPYEKYGASMRAGTSLAVDDINAAGGLLGATVRMVEFDDRCDVDDATDLAEEIVEAGVSLLVGHFCSGVSMPASEVCADEGIVEITPASSNPRLTINRSGPTIFRSYGRDDDQGIVVANYIADRFPGARVFVVQIANAYGDFILDTAETTFATRGIAVEDWLEYDPKMGSPSSTIRKLISERADVIYVVGYTEDTAEFVAEAREAGLQGTIIGTDSLMTVEFWDLAGPAAEGLLFAAHPSISLNTSALALVSRLDTLGVTDLEYAAFAYAAVQEYAAAALASGSTEADKVAEKLQAETFETVIGPIRFDEQGDLTVEFWGIYRHTNGTFEPVADTHWNWMR